MAYYCKLFAVTRGMELLKADPSGAETAKARDYLMNELADLEQMKAAMPEGTTKQDHATSVENFVASVFTRTDKEERTCETITKKIAVDFNRCSHFIMLLEIFDGVFDSAWDEKRKYCAYKAGNILKALKEGRQPQRGNPNDPNNTGEREIPEAP